MTTRDQIPPFDQGAVPHAVQQGNTTGQVMTPLVVPPGRHDGFFEEFWKKIVTVCIGVTAVGSVIYFLGERFFITRNEFAALKETIIKKDEVAPINKSIAELSTKIESLTVAIHNFDLIVAAEGLSAETVKKRRQDKKGEAR